MIKSVVAIFIMAVFMQCTPKSSNWILSDKEIIDVKIHSAGFITGPCEPTICISPQNEDLIIAGSVLNNVYVSNDGGVTWSKDILKSSYGVYGDPVVRFDNIGNAYYAHLSNPGGIAYGSEAFLDRIVVQKSSDSGKSWSNGSSPPADTLSDHDKHWLAIDPADNSILMSWTEFDKYGSKDVQDKSRILFSKSEDEGLTWTSPVKISQEEGNCLDNDDTTEGCTPAVGVNGEYYLVWSYNNKIFFDKSVDKGLIWMEKDKVVAAQPGGWTYDIPGIGRCNGMPIIDVDHSNGPNRGTIYINWSDQRNGVDDTDIWLISSKDGGLSWSKPIKINDDKGKSQQFLTWMDIDPITGHIYTVFYDRRNYKGNMTDVYLAYSTNGGKTFTNTKINKESFENKDIVFFGDYNDISAYNGRIRPIWTQQNGSVLSVHTALIDFEKK